jgi:HD-like signal output (HDOD) protein
MDKGPRHGGDVEKDQIIKAAAALSALGNSARLPPVVAALSDPEISVTEIVITMNQHPDLSARVLRVANSAYYGQTRTIETVDRAIMLLGLDAVRGIAAAACFNQAFVGGKDTALLDTSAFLRHSVAVAVAAEALARLRHRSLAPVAFVAGLLHDLGMLVALRLDPAGVAALRESLRADPEQDINTAEQSLLRVSHGHCVAVVLQAWHLPEALVAATQFHHDPMAAAEPHRALAALIHVADHIARVSQLGFACEAALGACSPEALALLGISDAEHAVIATALPDGVASLLQSLN